MKLTPTQRIIAEHVGRGKSTRDIATLLQRSPRTIEKHIEQIADSLPGDRAMTPMRRILCWALRQGQPPT